MTVRILPDLPAEASAALDRLQTLDPDSLRISRVLHDGYIQFGFPEQQLETDSRVFAPLSGSFVWSAGKFYLIQGRKHTDASLDKWEQSSRRKIDGALREQLKRKGGTLALDRGIVLGNLCEGREVLDRIAALPNDAHGQPLRSVGFRLEHKR